jgi:DNA-directed RNA polymerase subunit beta
MIFRSNQISSFIPNFVEIQRKSFIFFLKKGLVSEFEKRNPIKIAKNSFELVFYPKYYQLNPPDYNPKEAVLKSKTYACRLYIPAQLINTISKETKLQWVLVGNLPLMTKRGHFIINGCPRVIVNQMVRSPGIYYQELVDKKKKRTFYADLISHRGAWLRLETDKKKRVWARMKKTPKISIILFLQSFGFPKELIFQCVQYSNFLQYSFLEEEHPLTSEKALLTLFSQTHPKKEKTEISAQKGQFFLFRKFVNPRTYDLGRLGRIQLNKKLGLSIPLTTSTLTPQDILFATNYLINLEHGIGTTDDIDHLKNRRVRASGELIQNQVGNALIRLEKIVREKLKKPKKKVTIRSLITTKALNGALREFFGSSPLSQFMDETNPLAEITHKRRLSSLGPGGISRETAGMAVRGIHPSHYGRICPIETPEGQNAGLVNSITIYGKLDRNGFIQTPFYKVFQGQIQKEKNPLFFSAEQEEKVNIAPGDLKTNFLHFLPNNLLPIRNSNEFTRTSRDQIQYIGISPIQMISIATSLIPFLEHDDANRALMGSNMQRQAVPLLIPERPVVATGLEARVVMDSGHNLQAEKSGFITYVTSTKILIQHFFTNSFLLLNPQDSLHFQLNKPFIKEWLFSNRFPPKNVFFDNKK